MQTFLRFLVSMWIVLVLNKPRASLRGYCRRFLLEPSPNLFVGKATRTLAEDLVARIEKSGIDAVMIGPRKRSDSGLWVRVFGSPARQVADLNGFQVVSMESTR